MERITFGFDKIIIAGNIIITRYIQLGIFIAESQINAVVFRDGNTKINVTTEYVRGVICYIRFKGIGFTVKQVKTLTDTIYSRKWIGVTKAVNSINPAVVKTETNMFTTTHKVLLGHIGIKDNAVRLRITNTR